MKRLKFAPFLMMLGLVFAAGSCSEDKLDEIDTNPNNPQDASLQLLLPQVETNAAFGIAGTDLAWHASIFVEHSAGVHAQFQQVDNRDPGSFNASSTNNDWDNIYAGELKDLQIMIDKGSTGNEAGAWTYVGIAKILKAYTLGIATDLFGRIPNTEALQAPLILRPKYDTQESVYANIIQLLNEGMADLDKESTKNPGNADMFFGGNAAKWKKVASALKARYENHLSKRDPQGSANKALAALATGFASSADNLTFSKFTTAAAGENPWFQERNDRSHFAVSSTLYGIFTSLNDPRATVLVAPTPSGARNPAPTGETQNDQGSTLYSRASSSLVNATAPLPMMTYSEQKFIEAEANLRLGKKAEAYAAYLVAIAEGMKGQGVPAGDIEKFIAQGAVSVGADNLTLENIITHKYLSFYIYQSIEAYNDYRRTGFPALKNPNGPAPRRFPYPQGEFDTNKTNVPTTTPESGVWWDDGSED